MKDYTQYDFDSLVDRATTNLKDKRGWDVEYESSVGQEFIQMMADVTDYLHFMLENRTRENFKATAKLRSSIIARASESGYRIMRASGNSGFVLVSLKDEDDNPKPVEGEIVIPSGTVLTSLGRTFIVSEEITVPEGATSFEVSVREGVIEQQEFVLDETDVFFTDFSNIDNYYFIVRNEGEQYKDVRGSDVEVNKRAISFADPDEAVFDIKYEVNGMRVEFGDGNFGKAPAGTITVDYLRVNTELEPIIQVGVPFEFSTPLVDFQDPSITYLYDAASTTPISGGRAEESLSEIVTNSSFYIRTNGRAVTNEDYEFWGLRSGIGDLSDIAVSGEEDLDSIVYNANNVYFTYATSTGIPLTVSERQGIRDFFKKIKTSQAHLVINQAKKMGLKLDLDVRRQKNVPISNAQAYKIIYDFMDEYLRIKRGSIGGFFHLTDMIDALYDIKINRQGIDYQLVDYVRLESDGVIPFDFPPRTGECFIEVNPAYVPVEGHQFIVNLANLVCLSTINEDDAPLDILLGMRDVIREITPLDAAVEISGIALDAVGNPLPIEINPRVGYHLLVGYDTPYLSKDQMVRPAVVGSSVIGVTPISDALSVVHYYYSSIEGRRPLIPLRANGTRVRLTAPSDTEVNVYTKTDAFSDDEVLIDVLAPNSEFDMTFNTDHILIFEYANDSNDDRQALIDYPSYQGVTFGIRVKALDAFGTFNVVTSSGDLAPFVSVDYSITLPTYDPSNTSNTRNVLAGSVRICNEAGDVLYRDNSNGRFITSTNSIVPSGRVDYRGGKVIIPKTLPPVTPAGKYLLIFDQDVYQNFNMGPSDVIQFIKPKPALDSNEFSLSKLTVG